MEVRTLANTDFNDVIHCFLKAFENYYVPLPNDIEYYRKRWRIAKVDFSLSYGMFDGDSLLGFIIHAISKRDGRLIAFNTGTGVLPTYRGKGIAELMYEFALNDLRDHGVSVSMLEVIVDNTPALHLYQKIGFEITRTMECYQGSIELGALKTAPQLFEINLDELEFKTLPNQSFYSWDNHYDVVRQGDYRFFQIFGNNGPESYFIINPSLNYLAQFDVVEYNENAWANLFFGIQKFCKTIKVNNVDERLNAKIGGLKKVGLQLTVKQYEMELRFS